MQTQAHGREQGGIARGAGALVDRVAAWARWLLRELAKRREILHQRRGLLELDDHLLKDIGLRREDALREADRLLWQEVMGPRVERPQPQAVRSERPPKKGTAPWAGQGAAGVKRPT